MDDYNKKKYYRRIKICDHRFHVDCIFEWITKKEKCPLCNQKLSIGVFVARDLKESEVVKKLRKNCEVVCYKDEEFLPSESNLFNNLKKSTFRLHEDKENNFLKKKIKSVGNINEKNNWNRLSALDSVRVKANSRKKKRIENERMNIRNFEPNNSEIQPLSSGRSGSLDSGSYDDSHESSFTSDDTGSYSDCTGCTGEEDSYDESQTYESVENSKEEV